MFYAFIVLLNIPAIVVAVSTWYSCCRCRTLLSYLTTSKQASKQTIHKSFVSVHSLLFFIHLKIHYVNVYFIIQTISLKVSKEGKHKETEKDRYTHAHACAFIQHTHVQKNKQINKKKKMMMMKEKEKEKKKEHRFCSNCLVITNGSM